MSRTLFLVMILLGNLLLVPQVNSAEPPEKPKKKERCPVCGMFVAPYPDWIAALQFKDGSLLYFDGAKDLFRYYFTLPNEQDQRTREEVKNLFVTDYYTTRMVPAQQVSFVIGSDIYGPMGDELVPILGKSAAASFFIDHKGQKMLTFEQLNPEHLPPE